MLVVAVIWWHYRLLRQNQANVINLREQLGGRNSGQLDSHPLVANPSAD